MRKPKPTRVATMEDVARVVGVSKMTVSYVFSGKRKIAAATQQAVLKAAKKLNFEPNPHAQHLSQGRSPNICLYSPHLNLGVDTLKIRLIRRLLQDKGYDISFHSSGSYIDNEDVGHVAIRVLRRQRPRAIICATSDLHPAAITELKRYQAEGGLVIYYDHPVPLNCDSVIYDPENSMYKAARYLLQLGHRQIGLHILGPPREEEPKFVPYCVQAFERALQESGLMHRPQWLFRGLSYDYHEAGGVHAAQQFLQLKQRPTGMCIVNDSAAAAFVAEVQRAGVRVPDDLSIVGADDLPIARYGAVPLTTIAHPVESIVEHIVALLTSRLEEHYDGPPRQVIVPDELVVRDSTASPKHT